MATPSGTHPHAAPTVTPSAPRATVLGGAGPRGAGLRRRRQRLQRVLIPAPAATTSRGCSAACGGYRLAQLACRRASGRVRTPGPRPNPAARRPRPPRPLARRHPGGRSLGAAAAQRPRPCGTRSWAAAATPWPPGPPLRSRTAAGGRRILRIFAGILPATAHCRGASLSPFRLSERKPRPTVSGGRRPPRPARGPRAPASKMPRSCLEIST